MTCRASIGMCAHARARKAERSSPGGHAAKPTVSGVHFFRLFSPGRCVRVRVRVGDFLQAAAAGQETNFTLEFRNRTPPPPSAPPPSCFSCLVPIAQRGVHELETWEGFGILARFRWVARGSELPHQLGEALTMRGSPREGGGGAVRVL